MPLAHSKLTAQGQISVPAVIRRRLALRPGAVLEWDEADGQIVVRRAGRYTSKDVHRAAFPDGLPKRRSLAELTAGIAEHLQRKHARR